MKITFDNLTIRELTLIKEAIDEKVKNESQSRNAGYEDRRLTVMALQEIQKKLR